MESVGGGGDGARALAELATGCGGSGGLLEYVPLYKRHLNT